MKYSKLLVMAFYLISLNNTIVNAADWPQFRGLNRDGKSPEKKLLSKWPASGPKLLWSVKGMGKGFSSTAIANKMVYTTGMVNKRGIVFAYSLNGKLLWKTDYGREWSRSYPGTRTTPTINDGRLYVYSGYGVAVCMNAKSGKLLWRVDTLSQFGGRPPTWGIAESPLITGNKMICTPGGKRASLVALDKTNGRVIWATQSLHQASAYCSPIASNIKGREIIFTMLAKSIIAVNASNGQILWQIPHKVSYDIQAVSPLYNAGRLYITNGYGKGSMEFALNANGLVPREVWADKMLDCHHGGVVLVDGNIHGTSSKKRQLVCLDWLSGKVKYSAKAAGKGSVIYADGKIYCYGENGTLALVKPGSNGYTVISSFKIKQGNGQHWAHPAISDGRLYIRHGDTLMVFDIRQNNG